MINEVKRDSANGIAMLLVLLVVIAAAAAAAIRAEHGQRHPGGHRSGGICRGRRPAQRGFSR